MIRMKEVGALPQGHGKVADRAPMRRQVVIPAIFRRESIPAPPGCPLEDCGHDGPGTRGTGCLSEAVCFRSPPWTTLPWP
jgi:hypothetical protein